VKRLAILLLALSVSSAFAATPTLRAQPPRVANATVYTFGPYEGWWGGGFVDFVSSPQFFGAPLVVRLQSLDGGSIIGHTLFTPSRGRAYAMSAWVNGDGAAEPQSLIFYIDVVGHEYDTPGAAAAILPSDIAPGWQRVDLGTFINTDFATWYDPDPTRFVFGAGTHEIVDGSVCCGSWFIGQIEFREVELTPPTGDFGSE
jgi:hypothetical protein